MDATEEIKNRLSIEDVVGRYVDLKRSGSSYKGLCPFHQEKTPSFYVSPSKGIYHCYGCSRGGDLFSFVMEMEKLSFPEALRRLADQAGVQLPERKTDRPSLAGQLVAANDAATHFFREALASAAGERARRYLEERAFGEEAIELFELGYAPDGREALVQRMRKAGFDDRMLLAAGLALQDDLGGKLRDRFRGRLMFPIRDRSGRIVGFGGRALGDTQPKYLNSPQTEIFDKSSVLFGIHRAQEAIRQAGKAVLVEGYLDAIRAHLSGYSYTVASLGTAVTSKQLATLARLTDTVILALDPDPAGLAAAARTSLTALAEVMRASGRSRSAPAKLDLRIARLPEGHGDPDELLQAHPELWDEALLDTVPAFEFYFVQVLSRLDRSSDRWRQEAIERLLPMIQQFASAGEWQGIWIQRLADETGIGRGDLLMSLPKGRPTGQPPKPRSRPERGQEVVTSTTARGLASNPAAGVERDLVSLLLRLLIIPTEALRLLDLEEIEGPEHRVFIEHLLAWQATASYDYEMFRESLPEEVRERADELHEARAPLQEDKISVNVESHLARMRYFRVKAQQARIQSLLQDVDAEGNQQAILSLAELERKQLEINQALDRLSRLTIRAGRSPVDQGTIDQDSGRL